METEELEEPEVVDPRIVVVPVFDVAFAANDDEGETRWKEAHYAAWRAAAWRAGVWHDEIEWFWDVHPELDALGFIETADGPWVVVFDEGTRTIRSVSLVADAALDG